VDLAITAEVVRAETIGAVRDAETAPVIVAASAADPVAAVLANGAAKALLKSISKN
jgi:hypothetical protein